METHQDTIERLRAQGVNVMPQESIRKWAETVCRHFGITMEQLEEASSGERKIELPEGFSISKYIIEMRRGRG